MSINLGKLHARIDKMIDAGDHLKESVLNPAAEILVLINAYPHCVAHDLIKMSKYSMATVNTAIRKLHRLGMIEIKIDVMDKRRKLLHTTLSGDQIVDMIGLGV